MGQKDLTDLTVQSDSFLAGMVANGFFPHPLVEKAGELMRADRGKARSKDEAALCALTHAMVEEFNEPIFEFEENDSEIETGAREVITGDFAFLLGIYGDRADLEKAIATRDWSLRGGPVSRILSRMMRG